jgi:hypothetical protein
MDIELTPEAAEFGRMASRAIEAAGGDELIRSAELQQSERERRCDQILRPLGAWDLEPRRNADDLEAAAALCRSAGYWAVPYPVAERLARPVDLPEDGLVVVSDRHPAAPLAGTTAQWLSVDLEGRRSAVRLQPDGRSARQTAFVVPLVLDRIDDQGSADVALALTLPCWTLLGILDRALDMTRQYVLARKQFGQSLASFQGVQFQLTDAEVERVGLGELAKYTLWSSRARPDEAVDDALALRLAAIEAAEVVFRVAHQLHGAIGFCDETALSWLSRYSQPIRRLPFGLSETREHLVRRAGTRGLAGLYDVESFANGRDQLGPSTSGYRAASSRDFLPSAGR